MWCILVYPKQDPVLLGKRKFGLASKHAKLCGPLDSTVLKLSFFNPELHAVCLWRCKTQISQFKGVGVASRSFGSFDSINYHKVMS